MTDEFPIADLIACARRELRSRKAQAHLARHSKHGKPTLKTKREIAMMEAIIARLREDEKMEAIITRLV
jgi:hypothetical protein